MGNETQNILELKLQHANVERELAKAQLCEARMRNELLRQHNGSLQAQLTASKTSIAGFNAALTAKIKELNAKQGELDLANEALKRLGERVEKRADWNNYATSAHEHLIAFTKANGGHIDEGVQIAMEILKPFARPSHGWDEHPYNPKNMSAHRETACGAEVSHETAPDYFGANAPLQDSVRDAGEFEEPAPQLKTARILLTFDSVGTCLDEFIVDTKDGDLLATALAAGVAAFKAMKK